MFTMIFSWFLYFQFLLGNNAVLQNPAFVADKAEVVTEQVEEGITAQDVYDQISANHAEMPTFEVFNMAYSGFDKIRSENEIREDVITVVDFSKPSTEKRMWVIDLADNKVLFHTFVAHGQGSGGNTPNDFSNVAESHKSSLGFYLTNELYTGKHGLSLRLDGLEKGFNDNARNRAIVVHGADYVSENTIKSLGRLGRSHGCPAVPAELNDEIVTKIAKKSVMFLYYPDYFYIKQSAFINYAQNQTVTEASDKV